MKKNSPNPDWDALTIRLQKNVIAIQDKLLRAFILTPEQEQELETKFGKYIEPLARCSGRKHD